MIDKIKTRPLVVWKYPQLHVVTDRTTNGDESISTMPKV